MSKNKTRGHSEHKHKMTTKERKRQNHLKLMQNKKTSEPFIPEHTMKNKSKKAA